MSHELWKAADELSARREPFVVVTVLTVLGGAPQKPGAKAIMTSRGLHWGTVGGGRVEARAIEHSQALLRRGARGPETVTWNLQRDLDMVCGGEVVRRCARFWPVMTYRGGSRALPACGNYYAWSVGCCACARGRSVPKPCMR